MGSRGKTKPVTDILSKATKALAKSRQYRDPGKTSVNSPHKSALPPKKAAASKQAAKLVEVKTNNNNLVFSSSDDDDDDINLLDEKSPSTFLEAMDNLYNSTVVPARKANKNKIGADVNVRSNEISDFSAKSDLISSGTPSISLTISEKVNNNVVSEKQLANLRLTRAEMTMQSSTAEVDKKDVIDENIEGVAIGKTHNTLESVKIPVSPVYTLPSFTPGIGHPHETVAALMKRGDRVSEETYRVLQMMVRGSEAANAAFEQKPAEVLTDSVEDDALKTDASISMALEEEDGEGEIEAAVSIVSENVTYVGGTIEDIVENLMSLDLEEEEETSASNKHLEKEIFEFKADNIQEASYTYPDEEDEDEYEDKEEESITLKEYLYESDFEPESSKRISASSDRNTKSEGTRSNNVQQTPPFSKSSQKSSDNKSASFSETANQVSKSPSKNLSTPRAEKATRIATVASPDKEVISYSLAVGGSSSPQATGEKSTSPSKSQLTDLENYSSRPKYLPIRRSREPSISEKGISKDSPSGRLSKQKQDTIPLKSESKDNKVEFKESSRMVRQPSSSKSKANNKPSKSRITTRSNPIEGLMNIDGEKSSRQRQKILSILRKELYEKELKRLNREQMKTERIQKKKEKEQEEDYRMLMNFRMSDGTTQNLPDPVESWETRSSFEHRPGRSTQPHPPHLSQMITLMNKYNFAAAGLQNKTASTSKANFGAPYFTRSGSLAEGNFQPPEQMDIPELVQEVLDSHHRMYAMTIQTAKQMGKKYKEFLKEQNNRPDRKENKSAPETKPKSSKVSFAP